MENPVRNQGPVSVACQARPIVRAVAKEKRSRASVKTATDSYMGQIPTTQTTVRCSVPKLNEQIKPMLPETQIRTNRKMCQVHHHVQQRWAEDRQEFQITSGKSY